MLEYIDVNKLTPPVIEGDNPRYKALGSLLYFIARFRMAEGAQESVRGGNAYRRNGSSPAQIAQRSMKMAEQIQGLACEGCPFRRGCEERASLIQTLKDKDTRSRFRRILAYVAHRGFPDVSCGEILQNDARTIASIRSRGKKSNTPPQQGELF